MRRGDADCWAAATFGRRHPVGEGGGQLLVQRERPSGAGLDVTIRDDSIGLGHASGHSAVAFAMYAVTAPHLRPQWRRGALGLASFVALARIYSGAHLPLDVVGGASLGVIVGEGFRVIEGRHARRERS